MMNTYFLFLRGVNIGGKNMIKMTELAHWMEALDFNHVKTYLQSGNVIFQSKLHDEETLAQQLEDMLMQKAALNIPCQIRNVDDLKRINTLLDHYEAKKLPTANLFVTLLSEHPSEENILKLKAMKTDDDLFYVHGKEAIVVCQQPYHKTKLSNNVLERVLKVKATSRNDNTMRALLKAITA